MTAKTFQPPTCAGSSYPVLAAVSNCYPRVKGRLLTCYSPVRHSCTPKGLTVRLACVKHAASVRPEPGSNSPLKTHPKQGTDSTSVQTLTKNPKKGAINHSKKSKPHQHQNAGRIGTAQKCAKNGIDFQSTLLSSQESGANLASTPRASTRRNSYYFSRLNFCCQIRSPADFPAL